MNWYQLNRREGGDMSQKKQDVPKFPDPGKSYASGMKTYLQYLPKELRQEMGYRQQYDPQFIEQQLGLQAKVRSDSGR